MNLRDIATIYLKELRDMLRDRRSLLSMIIIPTFVMPALMFGVGAVAKKSINRARQETPRVMVLGGKDSPQVQAELAGTKKFNLVPAADDWRAQISEKRIRAAIEIPADFEAGLAKGEAAPVVIYHYEGELKSGLAAGELDKFFRDLRERTVSEHLASRALPPTLVRPFDISRQNVAPPEKVGGNLFGGLVPYLIMMLCFTGAMYPALDLTAGEKERGTMETLLCSPVARRDIVLGKFLMVLTGSLSAIVLSLVSLGFAAALAGMLLPAGGGKVAASGADGAMMPMIDPLGLLGVVAMVLPVAVLFSALILTVALFAKSYKEAQSYVTPMMIVLIIPTVVGMVPGIDLNLRLALVPILNLSLVCKEMLSGVWNWHYIALILGSTSVYAAAALALAVKMFQRESVMFRA